jgi:acetyl esterase/lipase
MQWEIAVSPGDQMPETDLSDAYANTPYIPGAEGYPPRWAAAAEAFRDSLGPRAQLGLRYGAAERNLFDFFLPEDGARGLLVFIHGGYWRRFGRSDWSHLAAGAVARGWAVAMPSYTLAPAARIADIVQEMRAAVDAAAAEVLDGPLVLTGHSAGGHLSARLACADLDFFAAARLVRVLPISPVTDLAPLMQTDINDDLHIDATEAAAQSPALLPLRAGVAAHVWVGADERPVFLEQARGLANAWHAPLTVDDGKHHFDVIDGLAEANSALTGALLGGL